MLPGLNDWMSAVASASTASTVVPASNSSGVVSLSEAQTIYETAKPALVTALNLIPPEMIYETITWLDGVAAKATQYTGATYEPTSTDDWTVTFANGTTATVSPGIKLEYEKYVTDATTYSTWPTLKAEFVKVINEVISQSSADAEAVLVAAQDEQI